MTADPIFFAGCRERLASLSLISEEGWLVSVTGTVLTAAGLNARVGELCQVERQASPLTCEVIGFSGSNTLLAPLGELEGISLGSRIRVLREDALLPDCSESLGRVLDALGRADRHVVIFLARMEQDASFHPNFFFVHEGATYRPDPDHPHEVGWILGDVGPQTAGTLVMGYLVLPTRFDPQAMLEIWWNDRSVETVLAP